MDQEMRAFLEEREARMEARFTRLEARLDERFARLEARMDERFEKVDERFEKVETEGRHTRILVEGVAGDLRLVAEGLVGVTERLEASQAETAKGFEEVKSMLSPYYKYLDGRIQSVEGGVECLDRRVKVLEGRADRQREDVLTAIRRYLGKPETP